MVTKKTGRAREPVGAKTHAADKRVREELSNADLRKFADVLTKAVRPAGASPSKR